MLPLRGSGWRPGSTTLSRRRPGRSAARPSCRTTPAASRCWWRRSLAGAAWLISFARRASSRSPASRWCATSERLRIRRGLLQRRTASVPLAARARGRRRRGRAAAAVRAGERCGWRSAGYREEPAGGPDAAAAGAHWRRCRRAAGARTCRRSLWRRARSALEPPASAGAATLRAAALALGAALLGVALTLALARRPGRDAARAGAARRCVDGLLPLPGRWLAPDDGRRSGASADAGSPARSTLVARLGPAPGARR